MVMGTSSLFAAHILGNFVVLFFWRVKGPTAMGIVEPKVINRSVVIVLSLLYWIQYAFLMLLFLFYFLSCTLPFLFPVSPCSPMLCVKIVANGCQVILGRLMNILYVI